MLSFLLRRLALMVPTTLGVTLVVFSIYHAAPGDPATVMMGIGSGGAMSEGSDTAARADAFRREFGLDRNLAIQYLNYVGPFNLLRDGHPWFSTPYTERKVDVRKVGDEEVMVGVPLEIADLPGTSLESVAGWEADLELWLADGPEANAAKERLVAAGRPALPVVLRALFRTSQARGAVADRQLQRTWLLLESLGGPRPALPATASDDQRRELASGQWFHWYYTEAGGDRVQNTGARKWGGLLVGDLGKEMQTKRPVVEELRKRLKVTVPLSLLAVMISYLLALPLGIWSAVKKGTKLDATLTIALFVLYAIPTFWAGLMLILLFGATGMDLLPVIGLQDKDAATFTPWGQFKDLVAHSVLPIACLSYGGLAYLSRHMRGGLLEVIRQDFIRTARAKGLSERVVIYKHAVRNAMIPVITLLASILPVLIGGSIIVEAVFDVPGMGRYAFEGLLRRDFYIVMATTVFVGIMTQIGILLSDLTYSLVDPRIRHT
ncbi:MAG: ABC transporter permease subunit [Planctomycetaceae bacterium]|nr:ABC transporter permease subunit [Planctomycetaceae bacterium]